MIDQQLENTIDDGSVSGKPEEAQTGQPGDGAVESSARDRSTIRFPYLDIDQAMTLPIAIHRDHGLRCSTDELAASTNHKDVRSGAFMRKVAAAQVFDMIARVGDEFALTELGKLLVREDSRPTGKAKAFMSVELYRKLFEEFKGGTLPQDQGIESTMIRLGVVKKSADIARQVFRRSADQAGFFAYGKDRLIAPKALNDLHDSVDDQSGASTPESKPSDDVNGYAELMNRIKALESENQELRGASEAGRSLVPKLPASIAGILHLLPLDDQKTWSKAQSDNCAKIFKMTIEQEFADKIKSGS